MCLVCTEDRLTSDTQLTLRAVFWGRCHLSLAVELGTSNDELLCNSITPAKLAALHRNPERMPAWEFPEGNSLPKLEERLRVADVGKWVEHVIHRKSWCPAIVKTIKDVCRREYEGWCAMTQATGGDRVMGGIVMLKQVGFNLVGFLGRDPRSWNQAVAFLLCTGSDSQIKG